MSALHNHHRVMLEEESGIHPDLITARGYRTVTVKADLERLGFSAKQRNVPALVLPIYSPTGAVTLYQARPDEPRINKGKPVKYETPLGSSMALDVHPSVNGKLGNPSTPLFITEGVKKGDALVSRGLCAVALIGVWNWRGTNAQGGKAVLPEWEFVALNDRRVYVVFDSDVMEKKEVHAALVRLKGMLEHRSARVLLIYLPSGDGANKQGVDDYLASGRSVDDLLALATSELKAAPKEEVASRVRPEIEVSDRHMRDITADALAALIAANEPPTLYLRGTLPARVNGDKIEALTATSLKGRLDRVADFIKTTYRDGEPVTNPARPPADVPPDILALTELPFPRLEEIVHAPVFVPGGALLAEDGYNPEHGLLLKLRGLERLRADLPIAEALAQLEEVYSDFPFVETAGRAHALAMTLQPFVRPLIRGVTPMYLIDAPARGTGKGLLAEVMNLIPLGYVVPTMSQPRDTDELEKRITSVLLEARPIVFFDNVTRLGSEPLHAVLTSETWHGRILGKSETATVPNRAVWLASGNNVELTDEMTRRIIPVRLDAGVERPEERTAFKHPNLPGYVQAHRSELVSACLSLVQAWVNEGMPKGTTTLGRYESWAGIMGGILGVAGVSGFLEGRERLHAEADKETTEWAALCEAWWSTFSERPIAARELFDILKDRHLLLDVWGGRTQQGALQRIGHALGSRRDRVFGGYKIVSAGRDGVTRSAAYRLIRIGNKTTENPETTGQGEDRPSQILRNAKSSPGGFDDSSIKTTDKPPQNHRGGTHVQHGAAAAASRVSGVSVVLERPPSPSYTDDDLSHLIGTTEGEL